MERRDESDIESKPPIGKARFLTELIADAGRDGLHFRAPTEIATRILRALEDPEISLAALTRLTCAEPLMAAHMVAAANSAAFGRPGQVISDLRSAIAKLGLRNVQALAIAFLLRQMSEAPVASTPLLRRTAGRLWEHTAHVAALAMVLARRVTRADPEIALFAGIVHEVGCFYLLSRAAGESSLFDRDGIYLGSEAEMELLVELNRTVAHALSIPEPAMSALEYLWDGYLAIPPRSLGDTLLLAEQLAPVASPFCGLPAGSSAESGSGGSIEMIVDAETLSSILAESSAEVNALVEAFLR